MSLTSDPAFVPTWEIDITLAADAFGLAKLPAEFFDWPHAKRLAHAVPLAASILADTSPTAVSFRAQYRPLFPMADKIKPDEMHIRPSLPRPRDDAQSKFIAQFRLTTQSPPPMPSEIRDGGPGVVICAGGWRFIIGAYVTCGMVRDVSDLPIQIWHKPGEITAPMVELLADWKGVELVDAGRHAAAYPMEAAAEGWPLKALAAMASPFSTVWSFDADSYPVAPLENVTDHADHVAAGATFWPDFEWGDVKPDQWAAFGMGRERETGWESGQFVIDKRRHWAATWLTWWLNARSSYTYGVIYGDKDTFHVAWRAHGATVALPVLRPGWYKVGFVHEDFDGRQFNVHRVFDKPRIPIRGQKFVYRPQDGEHGNRCVRVEGLPREDRFWELLDQCRHTCRRLGVAE